MKATKKKRSQALVPEPPGAGPRKKIVLLAVSGMSPAILTETVWALANPPKGQEKIIPDEVVVITTSRGLQDIERDLLNRDGGALKPLPGWGEKSVWQTLREAVLDSSAASDVRLQFPSPRIIELPNPATGIKEPAADLRKVSDNVAAADFILREVRRFVEPDTRVIASIAGGRKTMGALLYACMSLLGRETDRVTHVLVKSPFDDCRGFFFPKQPVQDLVSAKDKQPLRAAEADIELADIPFVPLINRFHDLGEVPGGFMGLVQTYAEWLKRDAMSVPEAAIRFDRPNCRVWIDAFACEIEGPKALDILRFVFEANQRGWVNENNGGDFITAAELFKGSRGVVPALDRINHAPTKSLADEIHKQFKGPPADAWVKGIDSHKVSSALSTLRSFLRKKHCMWKPPDRSWRLPPFRFLEV